ncbi:MAG: F0F1 ATP synthase subunit B [bacterium]|nr:F0F1 ATP synthase subunit B [bacterium]MDD3804831.1 F0F1 ATP synthase subunit B [bacterium]MDD4153627.1 F0F1 ATP synthase subunit B [bacterium]MDD4558415.1 F0F1 ATP synthase subunit B [bacterium]
MFEIDWKLLLVQMGNFLFLLIILRLILFKPLSEILARRNAEIHGLLSHASKEKTKAERLRHDYEAKIASASEEAQRIVSRANQTGETIRNEIRLKTEQERAKLMELTRGELEEQRRVVEEQLREKASEMSVDIAARVLSDMLDEEGRRHLTEEMIKRVKNGDR